LILSLSKPHFSAKILADNQEFQTIPRNIYYSNGDFNTLTHLHKYFQTLFCGLPRRGGRKIPNGAASMKRFGLILKHLEASLQRFFEKPTPNRASVR